MKPGLLIEFDRWMRPVARLVEHLVGINPSGKAHEAVNDERICILKFFGMGSIIRLTSLLEDLQVDKARILLCTFDNNRQLAQILGYPNVATVRSGAARGLRDLILLLFQIKKFGPAWIIDLERSSNLVSIFRNLTALLFGIRFHGFDHRGKTRVLSLGTIHSLQDKPVWDFVRHWFTGQAGKRSEQLIETVEVDALKIIVNVNASEYLPERRYPRAYFQEAIQQLHGWDQRLNFIFSGSSDEYDYVNEALRPLRTLGITANNRAGGWSLTDLVKELTTCSLFITNDSGPMHLAAFLGVPTVSLWGPTHFQDFGYSQRNGMINISAGKPCSPCFEHPKSKVGKECCGRLDCMIDLPPSQIVAAAKNILDSNPAVRKIRFPAGMTEETKPLFVGRNG